MTYHHSSVHIVRIVDTDENGKKTTWYIGPYGSTRADQTADQLEAEIRHSDNTTGQRWRECYVEKLFSDDECLVVKDYGRVESGSLS